MERRQCCETAARRLSAYEEELSAVVPFSAVDKVLCGIETVVDCGWIRFLWCKAISYRDSRKLAGVGIPLQRVV